MADFAKFLNNFNPDPSKAGNVLMIINIYSMILAALSNTFAASKDKNTSAEDKKFLIPAGLVTGAANIGTYYAITNNLINFLKDDVGGKALKTMKENGTYATNVENFAKRTLKKAEGGLFKKSPEYIDNLKQVLSTDKAKMFEKNFKAGIGVLGAFAGAVISCAIVTPIIRDVSAYFIQKKMEKKNPQLQDEPYRPYFDPSHVRLSKRPITMKSYMALTGRYNSGMKI